MASFYLVSHFSIGHDGRGMQNETKKNCFEKHKY